MLQQETSSKKSLESYTVIVLFRVKELYYLGLGIIIKIFQKYNTVVRRKLLISFCRYLLIILISWNKYSTFHGTQVVDFRMYHYLKQVVGNLICILPYKVNLIPYIFYLVNTIKNIKMIWDQYYKLRKQSRPSNIYWDQKISCGRGVHNICIKKV